MRTATSARGGGRFRRPDTSGALPDRGKAIRAATGSTGGDGFAGGEAGAEDEDEQRTRVPGLGFRVSVFF